MVIGGYTVEALKQGMDFATKYSDYSQFLLP
jgi:hypothetical protein